MTKQELTTKQIQLMSDADFWDHYEMIAEAATQCPNSDGYPFDVTELRRFQNESHRRLVIIGNPKPIDLDAPNF